MTYLSFVLVSRNDDYGGNLHHRMQTCLDSIISLSERYEVPTEIQLVEWNPSPENQPLKAVLEFPTATAVTDINLYSVPAAIHHNLPGSSSLPLFEYIGKNVGIRRASGEFVLSTNPDLIYNRAFFEFLADRPLSHDQFYRINKYNLDSFVPADASVDDQLDYCRNHVAAKYTPNGYREVPLGQRIKNIAYTYYTALRNPWHLTNRLRGVINPRPRSIYDLHHLAAGDFVLAGKPEWDEMRGHPEFEYNFHVDSYTVLAAAATGLEEVTLDDEIRVYHQPHENQHDSRPRGEWSELVQQSRSVLDSDGEIEFNDDLWGLANEQIEKQIIASGSAL